jgi:FkbM family methyltransferase
MAGDQWVRSLGLDTDGRLFVEIENGIRLYDICLDTPLPQAVTLYPGDLMEPGNRRLYYRYLSTLNEIEGIMFRPSYDAGWRIREGDIVVDAGARIGTFTAKITAAVGEKGRIIAVEPEPRNYACLLKNIETNRWNNVIPVRKMLWSRRRSLPLYLSGNASAHSAFRDGFYSPTGESVLVKADTLDDILEGLGVESARFIKMDIEGSEIEALRGMTRTLRSVAQLSVAAYHPVEGKLAHTVVVPYLENLGFKSTYADGLVTASAIL